MMFRILLLISLYYLVNQTFVSGSSIIVKSLEQDDSLVEYLDVGGLRQVKYNKTSVGLSGKVKIFKRYPTSKLNFKAAKKMGNGYIPMSILDLQNQGYCDMLNNPVGRKAVFDDLFQHFTMPYNCDHEPGEYELTNYAPTAPQNMPSGEYRAVMEMFLDGKPIAKYKIYFVVK